MMSTLVELVERMIEIRSTGKVICELAWKRLDGPPSTGTFPLTMTYVNHVPANAKLELQILMRPNFRVGNVDPIGQTISGSFIANWSDMDAVIEFVNAVNDLLPKFEKLLPFPRGKNDQ